MKREEKCKYLIEKGYTYNPQTGEVKSNYGKTLKSKHKQGYLVISNKTISNLLQHQFAWYYTNKECVDTLDHINGVSDDNRICNLRSVTKQQNQFNRNPKGYYFNKGRNKYSSQIMIDGKSIHLGYFNTEEDARQSYINAKEKYHII
jgi:hypothetical protein